MLTLEFISAFLEIARILFAMIGFVFFVGGYRFIKIINLVSGLVFGFLLGSVIGLVLQSNILGNTIAVLLGLIWAFFNFVHFKYLKGVSLGIFGFILVFYALAGLNLSVALIMAFIAFIGVVIANHKYESITTMVVTSLLGALLLVVNISGIDINLTMVLISLLVGGLGFVLQYKVINR